MIKMIGDKLYGCSGNEEKGEEYKCLEEEMNGNRSNLLRNLEMLCIIDDRL